MINHSAYEELQQRASANYVDQFAEIDSMQQSELGQIGNSIPRDENGSIKYTTSMTPNQMKRAKMISAFVIAGLAASTCILIGAFFIPANIYQILLISVVPAAVTVMMLSSLRWFDLTQLPDLDSPKERQRIVEKIRTHQFHLHQINDLYGSDRVVAYQLLGEDVPQRTYQEAQRLFKKQAEAHRIYTRNASAIKSAYDKATRLSRNASRTANNELLALGGILGSRNPFGLLFLPLWMSAAYDSHSASIEHRNIDRRVRPIYKQAMQNLKIAYQDVTQPLRVAFQSLL